MFILINTYYESHVHMIQQFLVSTTQKRRRDITNSFSIAFCLFSMYCTAIPRSGAPRRLLLVWNGQRCFSTADPFDTAVVHRRGDDHYGSRQYVLLPPNVTIDQFKVNPKIAYSAIYAHRNIIFGAQTEFADMTASCGPLVDAAIDDCGFIGDQPQAVASLAGLCKWVANGLESEDVLLQLKQDDGVSFEAVKSVATGVPREGHSVLGAGTYRDAEHGWELVVREFIRKGLCKEANLYMYKQGELAFVEHLADKKEAYLRTAGGAMAKFYFV